MTKTSHRVRVRPVRPADILQLASIEAGPDNPGNWNEKDFRAEFCRPSSLFLVAEISHGQSPVIAGFLAARRVERDWEILNLGTHSGYRRRGIASTLLARFLKQVSAATPLRVWLEVRRSNHPARAFYEKTGFKTRYIRPNYYQNPPDDALVMERPTGNKP